jgi:hypothetical protein
MPNRWATQGAVICAELKRRPMTYAQMYALGCGLSPHKRCAEWLDRNPKWRLVKGKNARGLVTWRVRPCNPN